HCITARAATPTRFGSLCTWANTTKVAWKMSCNVTAMVDELHISLTVCGARAAMSNAQAHREPPYRSLSRSAEPQQGGDAVARNVYARHGRECGGASPL